MAELDCYKICLIKHKACTNNTFSQTPTSPHPAHTHRKCILSHKLELPWAITFIVTEMSPPLFRAEGIALIKRQLIMIHNIPSQTENTEGQGALINASVFYCNIVPEVYFESEELQVLVKILSIQNACPRKTDTQLYLGEHFICFPTGTVPSGYSGHCL